MIKILKGFNILTCPIASGQKNAKKKIHIR